MGKLVAKLGLSMLLSKFDFDFEDKAPEGELLFSPKQFVLTLKDEMNLKVTLRTDPWKDEHQ